jgi:hypothetical protein
MIQCSEFELLFVEAFYNEISAKDNVRLEEHLKTCEKCAAEYAEMKATLNLMNSRERKEPPPGFWENYLPKLEERISNQKAEKHETTVTSWRRNLTARHAWTIRLAAAIAFVSIGIWIGKHFKNEPIQQTNVTKISPSQNVTPAQASADDRAMRYLQRSQVLLLGLVNYEPEQSDTYVPDLSRKKAISRELIQEATALKQDLNSPEQRRLKELVSDLEVILVQIANLEERNDMPQIELVKNGVDRKGILLKINLEEMRRNYTAPSEKTKSAPGQPEI